MDLEFILVIVGLICAALVFIASKFRFFTVVQTGSNVVIERLGKFHKVLEPGIHLIVPLVDTPRQVRWSRVEENRTGNHSQVSRKFYNLTAIPTAEQVHDLPAFQSSTRDRIDVFVNGLVFFRIQDIRKAVYQIDDLYSAVESLVETAIRQFTSTATLEECFVSRDKITAQVISSLNDCEKDWGIKVLRFDIQEINCSAEVRRATEAAVLRKREAEARLAMAEANKQSQLMEMQVENEVNLSRSQAHAELTLRQAETERKLAAIKNQMALEETENSIKKMRMEQEEKAYNMVKQFEAEAEGMRALLQVPGVTTEYLRHRNQLEAWSAMASNQNNKIVLPYNSVPLLGAQALFNSLTQDPAPGSTPQ